MLTNFHNFMWFMLRKNFQIKMRSAMLNLNVNDLSLIFFNLWFSPTFRRRQIRWTLKQKKLHKKGRSTSSLSFEKGKHCFKITKNLDFSFLAFTAKFRSIKSDMSSNTLWLKILLWFSNFLIFSENWIFGHNFRFSNSVLLWEIS